MDINSILPVIASVVGVAVGWILNEISSVIKWNRENRISLNTILFNLLEVRFVISRSNPITLIEMYVRILKKRFGSELPKEIDLLVGQIFTAVIQEMIVKWQQNQFTIIQEKYVKSVEELSKVDPVEAYWLSGKLQFHNYLKFLNEYFERIGEILKGQNLDGLLEKSKRALEPTLHKEVMHNVTRDITRLAWGIGSRTWIRAKKAIRSQDGISLEKDMAEFLDDYLKNVVAHV